MPRINLTISEELSQALQAEAVANNIPVNLVAVEALERLFIKEAIDYSQFINALLDDIDHLPRTQTEFTLSDLKTYNNLGVSVYQGGQVKPDTIRARIGKAFNVLERNVGIRGISRTYTIGRDGKPVLKFVNRAAVYSIDWSARDGQ